MYRKYFVYMDDGHSVFKVAIAAKSEESARAFCAGNGEIIAVRDVTDEHIIEYDAVFKALSDADFGDHDIDFIMRALSGLGIVSQ